MTFVNFKHKIGAHILISYEFTLILYLQTQKQIKTVFLLQLCDGCNLRMLNFEQINTDVNTWARTATEGRLKCN